MTPVDEKLKLKVDMEEEEVYSIQYYSIDGKYLHLIYIYFHIQFATRIANRFMPRPQKSHLLVAKRILCYNKYTHDYEIVYRENNQNHLTK